MCINAEMDDIKDLDDLAKKQERTRSFLIREAIKEFLKKDDDDLKRV